MSVYADASLQVHDSTAIIAVVRISGDEDVVALHGTIRGASPLNIVDVETIAMIAAFDGFFVDHC